MLADVLGEVPPFLPACMGTFQNLNDGIRLLRLVSKDVGRAVLRAINKVKVRLGEPPAPAESEEEENGYEEPPDGYYYNKHGDRICPSAAEVSTFMQGKAPLQALDITVIIKSGPTNPSVAQQLVSCASQLACLLSIIGPAVLGVTHIKLDVELPSFLVTAKDSHGRLIPVSERPPPMDATTIPGMYTSYEAAGVYCDVGRRMVLDVCKTLAAACPRLSALSLAGCKEAAIAVFGEQRPEITSLHIEARNVPLAVLTGLGKHFPKLTHFTLVQGERRSRSTDSAPSTTHDLQAYVGRVISELASCMLLTSLSLDLGYKQHNQFTLDIDAVNWQLLPGSIEELSIACRVTSQQVISDTLGVFTHLRRLTICHDRPSVYTLLPSLPDLQAVTFVGELDRNDWGLSGPTVHLLDRKYSDNKMVVDILLLERRCRAGLQITCPLVALSGFGRELRDILSWLNPMPATIWLKVHFSRGGEVGGDSLADLHRVLPGIQTLMVSDESEWRVWTIPVIPGEILDPLQGCLSLRKLDLQLHLALTTSGLAKLCLGLPWLKELSYSACPGVVHADLLFALRRAGRFLKKVVVHKDSDYGKTFDNTYEPPGYD